MVWMLLHVLTGAKGFSGLARKKECPDCNEYCSLNTKTCKSCDHVFVTGAAKRKVSKNNHMLKCV